MNKSRYPFIKMLFPDMLPMPSTSMQDTHQNLQPGDMNVTPSMS